MTYTFSLFAFVFPKNVLASGVPVMESAGKGLPFENIFLIAIIIYFFSRVLIRKNAPDKRPLYTKKLLFA